MKVERIKFWTKQEAGKYLTEAYGCKSYHDKNKQVRFMPSGTYCCQHGEYERPDYKIIKLRCGRYGIYARYYYYKGTFGAPVDGPLTVDNARAYSSLTA